MTEDRSESCAAERNILSVMLRSPEVDGEITDLVVQQAENDDQLVALWLHGRPENTVIAYSHEVDRLRGFLAKPLRTVTLSDIQAFSDELDRTLMKSSSRRAMTAVKSLLAFGFRLGYLPFDVGRALKLPTFRDELAERIISETDVLRIITLEPNPRNKAILMTLYTGGFRVSEVCSLKWRHLQERDDTGQVTVFGKGGKTRTVLLPENVWEAIQRLAENPQPEAPVFRSRKRGHLGPSAVWRIVKKASMRAGVDQDVSCHWFRHAHASHALDRGCPIHLVQATLGHASISTTGRYLHARPSESSGSYLPT